MHHPHSEDRRIHGPDAAASTTDSADGPGGAVSAEPTEPAPTARAPSVIPKGPLGSLRVLLLQARAAGDPVAASERRAFATASGLPLEHVHTHDLLQGPPSLTEIRRHDVLMAGGSGEYYVSRRNLPGMDATLDRIREVVETGHPTFASCFGFQLLVEALGGRVIHDPDRVEVGTFDVTLTEEGTADPLFGELPRSFKAQMGRKDRAELLPEGVVHLASSDRCPYHAVRLPGKPIWSTQFHPELDCERNRMRFERYLDGYAPVLSEEERRRTVDEFVESPETDRLLSRFLQIVFG